MLKIVEQCLFGLSNIILGYDIYLEGSFTYMHFSFDNCFDIFR